jgi:hypothetical protein
MHYLCDIVNSLCAIAICVIKKKIKIANKNPPPISINPSPNKWKVNKILHIINRAYKEKKLQLDLKFIRCINKW